MLPFPGLGEGVLGMSRNAAVDTASSQPRPREVARDRLACRNMRIEALRMPCASAHPDPTERERVQKTVELTPSLETNCACGTPTQPPSVTVGLALRPKGILRAADESSA